MTPNHLTTELADLVAALANLGDDRLALKRSAAEVRDRCVRMGDYRPAAVYNALAALLAAIDDDERAVIRAMQNDLVGGVAELIPEDD